MFTILLTVIFVAIYIEIQMRQRYKSLDNYMYSQVDGEGGPAALHGSVWHPPGGLHDPGHHVFRRLTLADQDGVVRSTLHGKVQSLLVNILRKQKKKTLTCVICNLIEIRLDISVSLRSSPIQLERNGNIESNFN